MEKKTKMVLCDDNEVLLCFMKKKIEQVFAIHNVAIEVKAFTEAMSALAYCKEEGCDFALLDIGLPEISGFQLAKKIKAIPRQNQIHILFMSAIEDIVYQVFQYQPFDFLRKSHIEEDVEKKIARLIRECIFSYRFHEKKERVDLVRGEDACVYLQEIYYFKSERNHLDAYTKTDAYRCKGCLKNMVEKYSDDLIQTDKQHLVNIQEIKKIRRNDILLQDGRSIPLSRRRKKHVEERYFSFMARSAY